MFNRKCHEQGKAIKIVGGMVVLCKCLEASEILSVYDLGRIIGKGELTNV